MMKRRRWNWDEAKTHRKWSRWLEYEYFQQYPDMRGCIGAAFFTTRFADGARYCALPLGVWRRRVR